MIGRIRVHNRLNGTRFATLEFAFTGLAALFIAVGLLRQDRWLLAALACGTAVNCAVVAGFGARSWLRGDRGGRIRELSRPEVRRTVRAEHPHLLADTILLAVSTLVPFVLSVAVLTETVRGDAHH